MDHTITPQTHQFVYVRARLDPSMHEHFEVEYTVLATKKKVYERFYFKNDGDLYNMWVRFGEFKVGR